MRKVLWTLGVWAFCGLAGVLVLSQTAIGPTIYAFDALHGVHLGDVVACVALPALALWLTWSFWR